MLRDSVILRVGTAAIIEIEIVCQCDTMSRCDWCNLVFNVAEECHVTYRWLVESLKRLGRVEDPFVAVVAKKKSSTRMGRRKDDDERPKHPFAPWSIDVRLKERSLA
jgi:hypothetical protein